MRMSKSMETMDVVSAAPRVKTRSRAFALLMTAALCAFSAGTVAQNIVAVARTQSTAQQAQAPVADEQTLMRVKGSSVSVTLPNGFASIVQDDMTVQSSGGPVRWTRVWDGQEWKFNPHWESLSQSWKNLTGSQTADTTPGTVSGDTPTAVATLSSSSNSQTDNSGCWVWVDEDWEPSAGRVIIGGVLHAGPAAPERITPFNRIMGEDGSNYSPPIRVSVDYASLCAGTMIATGVQDLEGIRRQNELYLGDAGRYAFSNRAVLEKRAVRQIPELNSGGIQQLTTGSIALAPTTNSKGYRWIHKEGDWIDFNTQGQVVAYGDRNDNVVWLVRDQSGTLRGVVDAVGHVLYTFHYSGPLLTEVRDYPMPGNDLDLPPRSVRYQYDERNLLAVVTDVRGNTIRYGYDNLARIVSVTDQEGRIERIEYNGDTVSKRTLADGTVTDYVFEYDDANKQFSSKISGAETEGGRRVEDYTHNRSGKLVRHTVNGIVDEEVRYDTGARAESHTNARGFVKKTTRNEFELITRVDYPDGTNELRSYSPVHLGLTEEVDEAGVKTQYQYDLKGNLTRIVEAAGLPDQRTIDYQLNSLGQTTQITLRGRTETNGFQTADAVWSYEYDSNGLLIRFTDPEGNSSAYVNDRAGNLVRHTTPRGFSTRYEMNVDGTLKRVIDPLNHVTEFGYDRIGNPVSLTDPRGHTVLAAYDSMNRQTTVTSPVGGVWRVQYNGQGLPVSETDEDGRVSRTEFDPLLRLTKEIDAAGNVTEYGYTIPDGTGAGTIGALFEPTEIRYPTFTQRQRYDQRERLTNDTLLNPNSLGTEGLVSGVTYDKRGLISTYTDENGKTSFYTYNAHRQLTESKDSLGNVTRALYDVRGNLIQLTDPKNNISQFRYDRDNRVVREILPLGQTTSYAYDADGNLMEKTDPNGHRSTFEYDDAGRIREIERYRGGVTLVRTTTLAWDEADNLSGWTDIDFTRPAGQQVTSSIRVLDTADRLTSETLSFPNPAGGSFSLTYGYEYSAAGYKTGLTWADGTQIDYAYSAHGELEGVTIPGEGTLSVNEFKWLAPAKVTLPGGSTQIRAYDGLLNLEELKVRTPGQQSVLEVANSYGKTQELKSNSRTDTSGGISTAVNSAFSYDDELRLTQAVTSGAFGSDTETFTLDAMGNRIAHTKVAGAWSYDANNRLLQKGTGANAVVFEYDEAGNLTRKTEPGDRVTQYTYDTQNRLIQVADGTGDLIARYGYDVFDARLWKEQYRDRQDNTLSPAKRTYYLYSDEGLLAEAEQAIAIDAAGAVSAVELQPTIVTQYGPQPDSDFSTGVLFVKTRNSNGNSTVAYFHNDQIETPLSASDRSGNLVWSATYNVFGEAAITTPVATPERPTISSNLRLPGQYADVETGLHYNFRRYYDPQIGRYISQDPIGIDGGVNLYKYAEGDPLNTTDPTGECPYCIAYAGCFASCMLQDAAENAITGECNNFGESAKNCGIGCAIGLGFGRLWQWGRKLFKRNPCGNNSFDADTLVHVRRDGMLTSEAMLGVSELRPIASVKVGDEVLALAEWRDRGGAEGVDERLSYEKVTNVYTSFKEQFLVRLVLEDGTALVATEGHVFRTTEGWRDAVLVEPGMQIENLSTGSNERTSVRVVGKDIQLQREQVFNLEIAGSHTFFVEGVLAHNDIHHLCTKYGERGRRMDKKLKKAGYPKGVEDARNKVEVPGHKGRHPSEYHERIEDGLDRARAKGKQAVDRFLSRMRREARTPGTTMNDQLTKRRR